MNSKKKLTSLSPRRLPHVNGVRSSYTWLAYQCEEMREKRQWSAKERVGRADKVNFFLTTRVLGRSEARLPSLLQTLSVVALPG